MCYFRDTQCNWLKYLVEGHVNKNVNPKKICKWLFLKNQKFQVICKIGIR